MRSISCSDAQSRIAIDLIRWIGTITVVLLTAHFRETVFLAHVIFVTASLLLETHKLNASFGKFKNPYKKFEIFLYVAGTIHTINPALMINYPDVVYIHVPVCFTVHVFHMTDVHLVFSVAKLHDPFHFFMLATLNLLELATNIAFMFAKENPNTYMSLALATEITCLMILSIKLQKRHNHHKYRTHNASSSAFSQSGASHSEIEGLQRTARLSTKSRVLPGDKNANQESEIISG